MKMGYISILIVLLIALIFISGCGQGLDKEPTKIEKVETNEIEEPAESTSSNYIIEITGTDGLEFSGSIGGGGSSKTVDGEIPTTYEVSDWPAVAVIQKKEASGGVLTVTMKKNGRVLDSQTTDADYGLVTVNSG